MTEFLLMKDVKNILKVSDRTVYRLINDGELHAVKMGRAYLFTPADIEAYLRKRDEQTQKKLEEKRQNKQKKGEGCK